MIKMYRKDAGGQIREWNIWFEGDEIVMGHGVYRGQMQEKREAVVVKGNNTLSEQIQSRIASRCSNKRDLGYLADLKQVMAQEKSLNAMGLPKPMLAHRMDKFKGKIEEDWWTQYKYNGHRCLVTKQDGKLFAYSRKGKPITTIDHIFEQARKIPEGATVDGELYHHGTSLQRISSWIKKGQAESEQLTYNVYDAMIPARYELRLKWLQDVIPDLVVPTHYKGLFNRKRLDSVIAAGYEGLIVRRGTEGYEDGKRSNSLLKVKKFIETEVQVIEIIPSVDGWARLICLFEGKQFKVSSPGTMDQKFRAMINKEIYTGKWVKIEYANLTDEGIPFHPTALNWIEDITI